MSKPKRMDIAEFRKIGYLQEVNRLFFHPHGLALAVNVVTKKWWQFWKKEGETLCCVYDSREDPEGWVFADGPSAEKALRVAEEFNRHVIARMELLGGAIQAPGQRVEVEIPTGEITGAKIEANTITQDSIFPKPGT